MSAAALLLASKVLDIPINIKKVAVTYLKISSRIRGKDVFIDEGATIRAQEKVR